MYKIIYMRVCTLQYRFWVKELALRRREQFICEMKRTKREERNKFGKTKGNGTKTERSNTWLF